MSALSVAVNNLQLEITEAEAAARRYYDGKSDTVDVLDTVQSALESLISAAHAVVGSWES